MLYPNWSQRKVTPSQETEYQLKVDWRQREQPTDHLKGYYSNPRDEMMMEAENDWEMGIRNAIKW